MLRKLQGAFGFSSGQLRRKVLIFSSLLATIPVMIMGIAAYYIASGKMIDEIGEANRQTMLQIQQRIDEKLTTLEKIVLQNSVNPTLSSFLSQPKPEADLENLGLTMSLLNSIQVSIEDVDAVYLYHPDKHLVVAPDRGIVGEETLSEPVRTAVSRDPSKIWIDHKLESTLVRDGFHQITFVLRINPYDKSSSGYLIVNLNDSAFFRVFSKMRLGSRELLIVTPSGNVFSDLSGSTDRAPYEDYGLISKLLVSHEEEKLWTEKWNGRSLSIHSLQSHYNGWKYVTVIPTSDLTRHLQKIKETTFLICLLLILGSTAATGILSKRWYRGLQSLMDLVKNKGGLGDAPKNQNEFTLIRNYFESLSASNEQLGRQIEESMPLLRANFIQKMLTEPLDGSLLERAEYYSIPVKHPYYTVICVELDNMRGQTEKDLNLFHYAVINIAKEILSRAAEGLVVRMHSGHIAILVNHGVEEEASEDPNGAILKNKAFFIAEEIRSVSESLLHITVTMGIGHSYEGLALARSSYREALEALEYQLVEGSGRVLYIGHIKPETASFDYPYEIEQQIVTHLKLAHLSHIQSLLDDFAEALRVDLYHHEHVRQSFAQLIAASLRTLYEMDPNGAQLYDYNLYQRLNELNTSAKIVNWLKTEVYPPIVEHLSSKAVQRNHSMVSHVLDYIHEHYDTDVSLSLLAGRISMPLSQLSFMFKEEVGMTFSDYLISHRMEKARDLLETTDLKISEIAERLRYNNSQNFIRVFKKINGIPPGEYRSRYSQKRAEG
ncbi:helix-turn-helix domain-containing protein [Gorillibacterium sp. sgz5001074]|uniref:helix-turn-helix domain-containing protein n=1 Tax=Gorillibacterium sp. sgz5001074 TaxID=3446695 RepID=UPI003F66229D